MSSAHSGKVAILLCTYNGEQFLSKQMDSFFAQSHSNWELWISDDGSVDATLDIIEQYRGKGKAITLLRGARTGAPSNFLHLLHNRDVNADYFAWSDQDDVWLPDKLSRAVAALEQAGLGSCENTTPAVYAGRTKLIDAHDRHIAHSPLFRKKPSFANALCQNIGGGNTMVFNRAAKRLLTEGGVPRVIAHDWWSYMLVTGAGGVMLYDPCPTLLYRQHGGNLVGENRSLSAKLHRLWLIFSGDYHSWNAGNVDALAERRHLLTPENAAVFDLFAAACRANKSLSRLRFLNRSGIYRQSGLDDWLLRIAALWNRYP